MGIDLSEFCGGCFYCFPRQPSENEASLCYQLGYQKCIELANQLQF